MKWKSIIILWIIFTIQFIISCCSQVKYFDFDEISVEVSNTTIEQGEELNLKIGAVDLKYISFNHTDFGFSNALAFDCDDGWGGMKYPLKEIRITSDSNFNDEHLADELLNDLFQVEIYKGNNETGFVPLSDVEIDNVYAAYIELLLTEKPTLSNTHKFKITLTKSNDEELIADSEAVIWQ